MKAFKKSLIPEIISSLFLLLFVYTATTKLMEHESFRAVLSQSPLIGSKANVLSWVIPILELITSSLLFIPSFRKWGFAGAFILMATFTSYITYMIFFTKNLPCSCGGVISRMTWSQHLIFNIFFTALAAFAWGLALKKKGIAINRNSRTPA